MYGEKKNRAKNFTRLSLQAIHSKRLPIHFFTEWWLEFTSVVEPKLEPQGTGSAGAGAGAGILKIRLRLQVKLK